MHRQGFSSVHRQGFSSVHKRLQALCTGKAPSSVHKRVQALCTQGLKLCAQKGSSSVHRQGFSSVHKRAQLCAQKGSALCTGRGSKLCVQARVQALCTKGSKLCAQARVQLCVHTGGFRVLCTKGFKLCAQKGSSSVHKRVQALCTRRRIPGSVHTQEDSKLCAHAGGLLVKNRVFELSDRTSLSSTVFYNPLPRHIHGKSNSFSASLGAKSILEKGLSTYFAESPLDFSVFLDFKSAKSTSVHREHLQKRLYPVFLPEPELPHLLQQSPSCYFCTGAGYSFALKSA